MPTQRELFELTRADRVRDAVAGFLAKRRPRARRRGLPRVDSHESQVLKARSNYEFGEK